LNKMRRVAIGSISLLALAPAAYVATAASIDLYIVRAHLAELGAR